MQLIKKILFTISIMMCFMNTTCESDDVIPPEDRCDQVVEINAEKYNNLDSNHFTFVNAEIIDDCLNIEISASGCSGNSWTFNLVDSGAIAESSPEQRRLKFELINDEACLAVFKRTVSFDLTPLKIISSNKIILHLDGLGTSVEYTY